MRVGDNHEYNEVCSAETHQHVKVDSSHANDRKDPVVPESDTSQGSTLEKR